MKKVFYCLAVAVVALSASAFTNITTQTTVFITGETGSGPTARWTYSGAVPSCATSQILPCELNAEGTFVFPDAPNSVLKSDVSDPDKVTIATTRASF